jgi:phage-related tail protein
MSEQEEKKLHPEVIKAYQYFGNGINKVITDKITGETISRQEAMGLVEAEERTISDFIIKNFKIKKNGKKKQA